MKYPKIQTLWKRDKDNNYVIMPGHYSKSVFKNITHWQISEKIDGTNIRITWDRDDIKFKGKTNKSEVPGFLLDYLQNTFTKDKFIKHFTGIEKHSGKKVILFGEGYGNKIQQVGDKYREDNGYILFDVNIDGWWLERKNVKDIAKKLQIKTVQTFGRRKTIKDIIDFVKSKPQSWESKEELVMEGIVAKAVPMVLFRDGTPVMFKLKVSDYDKLRGRK